MSRRVAITGAGVVSPLGASVDETWSQLVGGVAAVEQAKFSNAASGHTLTIPAARLTDSTLRQVEKPIAGLVDRFTRMALQAADEAVGQAAIDFSVIDRTRVGVVSGTCMGGISETEVGFNTIYIDRRAKVHPFTVIRTMYNAPAAFIAARLALTGPTLSYSTTCSSSAVAIGEAMRMIRHGYADVMIAGGSESLLTYSAVNCWHSAQLLAPLADPPSRSCRPFSLDRNGTVLGEGAAFLVLETMEGAVARRAKILGELVGYGCTADSGHVTQPSVEGQAAPMVAALRDGGVEPREVGYIHAHGTGTKANDQSESGAIRRVFGNHADLVAVSSSKAQIGHLVGAAGAIGVLFTLCALRTQTLPPTLNLVVHDPNCNLDYVPGASRHVEGLQVAACNAFGFGGTAATLVLREVR